MRANIAINEDGIIQPSTTPYPPNGGTLVKRTNKLFTVTLSENPTVRALLTLVRTLRAVETKMQLIGAGELNFDHYTRPKICIVLSQMALDRLEAESDYMFTSKIEILTDALLQIDVLPEHLFRLGQLSLGKLDVPTALLKANQAEIKNLVSVGQTMSMKLCFVATPKQAIWPASQPKIGETFDECLPPLINQWLSTIFETALAIRLPLYHHGLIKIGEHNRQPFQRLIHPIAPAHERAVNHRVLSVINLTNAPDSVLI